MTIKKALKILDYYIDKKSKMKEDFLDMNMSWNKGQNHIQEFSKGLALVMENDLKVLNSLKKELKPKCKHPKNLRDKSSDGNSYCMGCNLDL